MTLAKTRLVRNEQIFFDVIFTVELVGLYSTGIFVDHRPMTWEQAGNALAEGWHEPSSREDPPLSRRRILSAREVKHRRPGQAPCPDTMSLVEALDKSHKLRQLRIYDKAMVFTGRIVDAQINGKFRFVPHYQCHTVSSHELPSFCAEELWAHSSLMAIFSNPNIKDTHKQALAFDRFLQQELSKDPQGEERYDPFFRGLHQKVLSSGHVPSFFDGST